MELFSVTCITCRARLKVRHESAIGQILACPKCNGMVQIEPPPGWKRPSGAAAKIAKPAATASDAKQDEQADSPPPTDDLPLAPPGMLVAPHEARTRRAILIGGAVVAALIVGFGIWSTFGGREPPPGEDVIAAAGTPPTASPTKPRPEPSPTAAVVSPTPSPSPSSSVAPPVPTATQPSATPSPSSAPVPTASPSVSSPTVAVASASPTAPSAVATATPSPSLPAASPSPTAAIVPPPPAVAAATVPPGPVSQIDLAARLADVVPQIKFAGTPLRQALELVERMSTVRVNFDADSLAAAEVRLDEAVTLELTDVGVGDVFARLGETCGLQYRAVGDQIVFFVPAKEAAAAATVTYPIDDLTGTDLQAVAALADLLRRFAVPGAWDPKWGGSITPTAGKLEVTQHAVGQREVAAFLDRLRLARGKSPRDPRTTLETRYRQVLEALDRPVTMNFRPAARLPEITARLEAATGVTVVVHYQELSTQGFFGDEPIGIAADKHRAEDVLTALCGPRDWAWRIVGPKWLEITTADAVRRRPYVEFYALPTTSTLDLDGPGWATRIRTQLADEPWRDEAGADLPTAGEVVFDAASQRLIVRQHQGAQLRVERLLAEATKSPPAVPAPKATASPTAAAATSPIPPASPSTGGPKP